MIKVIAFDLVGVLVKEKDIELNTIEDKLERLFGNNISDDEYLLEAKKITNENIIDTSKNICNKLYEVNDIDLFKRIKGKYKDTTIIIATNHVTYVKEFISKNFTDVDDVIISAEIHEIKPNPNFYQYILDKYSIKPNELLFLDDNDKNIEGAYNLGINTIKVNKDTDIYEEIDSVLVRSKDGNN